MANTAQKPVRHQPKQLLWFGAVAGLLFTFFGLLSLALGSKHGAWQIIQQLLIIALAFVWAITSITKLRAQKT
jgi:formate/nitrite transporter FocA (FNT family)